MKAVPISVLIVDDEPLARYKLRQLFEPLREFRVCGEAGDGAEALRLIQQERPQLLCLDIRLPGMSGLDVLRRAGTGAAVIFTTAFDKYAVNAFELAAIDYLLKPFSRVRFLAAVERARARLSAAPGIAPDERMRAVSETPHLSRLFAREGDRVVPVAVTAVEYCESADDAVIVHALGRRYRLNITLSELEALLDPVVFLRVHRRTIVNLEHVAEIVPLPGSRFEARLKSGTTLPVSRERSRVLRGRGI